MTAKKIGKVTLDLEKEFWELDDKPGKYVMNRRLIDSRPEVKALVAEYAQARKKMRPPFPRAKRHEEFIKAHDEHVSKLQEALKKIYDELLQESFTYPVKMKLHHDFDHAGDWRFGLYEGILYQFDRPGYTDSEMIEQIKTLRGVPKSES